MNYNDEAGILIIPKNTELEIEVEQETTILTKVKLQEKTVIPAINKQEVTNDIEYDGLGKVTVEGVTNEIDSNIQPENILNGVNILGVDGNVKVGIFPIGTINITENGKHDVTDYESADVNVELDVSEYFTEIFQQMGAYGGNGISRSLKKIPQLELEKGSDMSSMYLGCTSITDVPSCDTRDAIIFANAFAGCPKLTTIPLFDMSSARNISRLIWYSSSITTLGGFKNLGQAYLTTSGANYEYYRLDLSYSTKITHESLMNVINNLYDIATKGCNTQSLVLGSTNLAKLTAEEIQSAQLKGWTVS